MTNTAGFRRAEDLFARACRLPAEKRRAFVSRECEGEPELEREVLELLDADATDDGFLETPAPEVRLAAAIGEQGQPEWIGGYRVIRRLGEGGMGVVYEAEQTSPRRRVAVKVIRPLLVSAETRRRFEFEAEVLARLEHPSIARIYEAAVSGVDDGGPLFFAMELVEGESLVRYADATGMPHRRRLELMADICDAVQHAHLRGIVHRDLKPANILVDPGGRPRILDFGVARAVDGDVHAATVHTGAGQLVGTLTYMSPEQAAGDARDIDARSDVYSLGVILYELLTGELPHDVAELPAYEAARRIHESEPTRLRTRDRRFAGDVDIIVHRALEPDRSRRYQSAADLGADIRRFLANEPITARPPSTWYQIRKFSRRHRPLVAGIGAAFGTLLLTAGVTGAALVDAVDARRAESSQRLVAEAVNEFLNDDLLAQVDPKNTADPDVTLREVLDRASDRIEGRFEGQPLVEAEIRTTMGRVYRELSEYEVARTHLMRSVELRRAELGPTHSDTLGALNHLAILYDLSGEAVKSEAMHREVYEHRLQTLGAEHTDTMSSANNLAMALLGLHELEEAEALLKEVLRVRTALLGEDNVDTLIAMNNLGSVYWEGDRFDDAEPYYTRCLELRRKTLGDDHPHTLNSIDNLATVYLGQGSFERALVLSEEALERNRRVRGEDHASTLAVRNNQAVIHYRLGDFARAAAMFEQAIESMRRTDGVEDWRIGTMQVNLGTCLIRAENYERGEQVLREAHDRLVATFGEGHGRTKGAVSALVRLYDAWGKPDLADEWRARAPEDAP
jgi:serine/threonine protein kinase/tetratricopeptide (TPR) repeat protein